MEYSSRKDTWVGGVLWAYFGLFIWLLNNSLFIRFDFGGIIVSVIFIGFFGCTKYIT